MTNHSDDDSLPPDIAAALRDVGPVDESLREAQISRALDELTASGTSGRRWSAVSVAAAAVVALAVGGIIGRSTGDTDTNVRNAATTTVAPAKVTNECDDEIGAETFVGEWTENGVTKFLTVDGDNFYVRDSATCEVLSTLTRP